MTNKEQTISNLKKLKSFHNGSYGADIDRAIKALEQEPYEDAISRKSIKQKLQEHHDFFVNAYGGFSNLPQKDKARVDEITNCIAMVVNEPSVTPQPKTGKWIMKWIDDGFVECPFCESATNCDGNIEELHYCFSCGAKLESEDKE